MASGVAGKQFPSDVTASVEVAVAEDDRSLYKHKPQNPGPGYDCGKAVRPLAKARFLQ